MPTKSADQLKERAAALRKRLHAKASGMEATAVRKAKKRIRRVQRLRRSIVARAARLAGAGKDKKEG